MANENGKGTNEDGNKKTKIVRPEDYRLKADKSAVLAKAETDPGKETRVKITVESAQMVGFSVVVDEWLNNSGTVNPNNAQCIVYRVEGIFILPKNLEFKITPKFNSGTTKQGTEEQIGALKRFKFENDNSDKIIIEISDNVVRGGKGNSIDKEVKYM